MAKKKKAKAKTSKKKAKKKAVKKTTAKKAKKKTARAVKSGAPENKMSTVSINDKDTIVTETDLTEQTEIIAP